MGMLEAPVGTGTGPSVMWGLESQTCDSDRGYIEIYYLISRDLAANFLGKFLFIYLLFSSRECK